MKNVIAIFVFISLTLGIILYFMGYELKWMIDIDNLFFYSICAGVAGLCYCSISEGKLNKIGHYLIRALCFYFMFIFIIFWLNELSLLEFLNIHTKWVYIPTGGLVICLVLSAIWHLVKSQRSM